MAVYQQFPRLYDQSGQGTTTNYYGGLNKSPTLSSYAGNQNVGKVGETPSTTPINTTPTPAPTPQIGYNQSTGMLTWDGQDLQRNDPRIYGNTQDQSNNDYWEDVQMGDSEGGYSMGRQRRALTGEYAGYVPVMQGGVGGYDEVIDPSQVRYVEGLGLITPEGNMGAGDRGRGRQLRNFGLAAIGGMAGAAALGLGATGTAGVIATDMAMPALAGVADTTLAAAPTIAGGAGAAGAGLAGAGAAAGGSASIAAPAMAMPELTGAASTALSAAPTIAGGSSMPSWGRTAMNLAGGAANWYLGNRTQDGMTAAADRADPYGQYRERGAGRLHELELNPDSVTQTPQYQFLQQQGEQGIHRTAAKTGYFRSPNMLFDLSKFNQGLAAQEYNKEWERRAAEAGVNINPSTGAQIQANGVTGSNNMRAAAGSQMITQIVNSAPDFYNWLFGA